jgi:6,7-dimethyl-8-ribityllumazine synthase
MSDEYELPSWGAEQGAAIGAESGESDPPAWPGPPGVEEGAQEPPGEDAAPADSDAVDELGQDSEQGQHTDGDSAAWASGSAGPAGVDGAEADADAPSDEGLQDPYGAWPEPEKSVVGDDPDDAVSVEHVSGQIDVPDGYTVLEGSPTGHRRSVALVVSRFNGALTNRMLACAIEALEDAGVATESVTVVPVPGAFELPLAAMALAKTRRYACVVALGAIVRGETPHFDYIASEAASGLQLAAIETGVPVAFGVLTVESVEQAEARIERAAVAVQTALEMADLFARLRASARAS